MTRAANKQRQEVEYSAGNSVFPKIGLHRRHSPDQPIHPKLAA